MKRDFLGDSYDIVKQSLLRWLAAVGPWATHPMFTDSVPTEQVEAYSLLLGTEVLSREILGPGTDREMYLAPARACQHHLFLDPDTGIRLQPIDGEKAPAYLFGPELVSIASARPEKLTLVFDQSLKRGAERQELERKLSYFAAHGIRSAAYVSHACFVLLGTDRLLLETALENLKRESRLSDTRFLMDAPQSNAMQRTGFARR